jgi:tetratricopeptide (TPR) repeat protein
MDFLFNIVLFLIIFAIIVFVFSLILSKRKKGQVNKKLKEIDKESKLIAIDDLRKLLKKNPNNINAREKLAELLFTNKSYLAAIKEYLVMIDHAVDTSEIDEVKLLNKIGNAYQKLDNFDDARKYFLIAKSKDDLNFETNFNLGQVEYLCNNLEKAEVYFNMAYKLSPDNAEVIKYLGICRYKFNNFKDAAEKLFRYLKEKNNQDAEAVFFLANSLYNLNRFDDAIKYFSSLKQSSEYSAESFYMLGYIRKNQKLFLQAVEDFNNALINGNYKEAGKLAELNYLIAECYFQSHDINKAIEFWHKTSDIVPNYKDVNEKIDNYSQVSSNYLLEMFLVGSLNQFVRICKLFVQYYVANYSSLRGGTVKFNEINTSPEGSLEILAEVTSGNFIEQNLFIFLRSSTTVGDMTIRGHYNMLKEKKADKGICVTAGNFSDSAKSFVESRMIRIIEKDELIEILNKLSKHIKKT